MMAGGIVERRWMAIVLDADVSGLTFPYGY
jgi:hypothetical protein